MKQVIDFLNTLRDNNNREWFHAHKAEYQAAQARFNELAEALAQRMAQFDPSLAGLTTKDITYRIYRDTRFSKDKTPYKTHMGAFICRGGKNSGYAGYYFQVGVEQDAAHFGDLQWDTQSILAPGHYCIDPKALQVLREDILYGEGDFDRIIRQEVDSDFQLLRAYALKRNPKGFDKDAPWSEYLRLKVFCLGMEVDNSFFLQPDVIEQIATRFESAKPFIDYINRAIEYVREEQA